MSGGTPRCSTPRHVRNKRFPRRDQAAARHYPGGRRRRGARHREGRQDRSRPDHERDDVLRSPRRRWRARRTAHRRVQDLDREPGDDGGLTRMADTDFDIIIIGSGPGGYVTAIRSAQLGFKTAIVERDYLAGICLNWGCIPTKALLRSAEIFHYLRHAKDYGLAAGNVGYH